MNFIDHIKKDHSLPDICCPEIGFMLTKEEARAIVNELGQTFISRDNPLCNEVLNKLMRFIRES